MQRLQFKKIRFKNFLSTGNTFMEYNLDQSGITAIIGKNGAGKSMLLDAMTFSIFGKSFRGCNKPLLINSINGMECVVEIEFEANGKYYKVIRGQKPNVFEIYENDELLNQDSKARDYQKYLETNIIRMNYKTFTQIVILGSSNFVPFMKLTALDRRDVIEDLLDIQIFSKMRGVLKEHVSENKTALADYAQKISGAKDRIAFMENHIKSVRKKIEEQQEKKKQEIDTARNQMADILVSVEELQREIQENTEKIIDRGPTETTKQRLEGIKSQILEKQRAASKIEKFYKNSSECPTCLQKIDVKFAESHIEDSRKNNEKLMRGVLEIDDEIEKYNTRLQEIADIDKHIRNLNSLVSERQGRLYGIKKYIENITESIESEITDDTKEYEETLREQEVALDELNRGKKDIEKYRDHLKYAEIILKDSGIKSRIIKEYLPVMNSLINKYLTALDFFVEFTLDENFKETVKSRHRDEFSYESFSEGQKFRINIAVLLAWRDIARLRNSATTNILILDEVFDSSLDGEGVDEFVKLLQNVVGEDTHVIVISHRGDNLLDKFSRIYEMKMVKGFSKFSS